ncbi:MAG TPA: GntR family transcriptional regulator [Lapillicoccus sp.]|jgi:DNA-binding GntR family transcriptional regulator
MSTTTPSAADRVYAQVKRDILGGSLPGGSLVTEGELAEVAGVSRTPVREALLRLEGEGLVRLYPKKGALVVPPSVDDARDVFEARVVIEEWAARAVWSRRADLFPALEAELEGMRATRTSGDVERLVEHDRRFHEILVTAAGNAVLTRTYQGLRDRQLTILAAQFRRDGDRIDRAVTNHVRLLEILRTGTLEELVAETHTHVHDAVAALQVSR